MLEHGITTFRLSKLKSRSIPILNMRSLVYTTRTGCSPVVLSFFWLAGAEFLLAAVNTSQEYNKKKTVCHH